MSSSLSSSIRRAVCLPDELLGPTDSGCGSGEISGSEPAVRDDVTDVVEVFVKPCSEFFFEHIAVTGHVEIL